VTLPTGTNPYALATPDLNQDAINANPIDAVTFESATTIFASTYDVVSRYDKVGANWVRTPITNAGLPQFHYFAALAVDSAANGSFYAALAGGGAPHLY
jgi:hypothetical protein